MKLTPVTEWSKTKGQLGSLQGIVLSLVIIGVLIGAAFLILGEFLAETVTQGNSDAVEGVNDTLQAMKKVPAMLGLIVLIAVIAIIVALIFGAFPGQRT